GRPCAAKEIGMRDHYPKCCPATRRMSRKKAPARFRVHSKLFFQVGNEFLFKSSSPGTVVDRVGEYVMAQRAVGLEINVDHLRTRAVRHRLCKIRCSSKRI